MLNICRQRTEACGVASRCTFYEGYLDSLPASDAFDTATCLLVSQFIMQIEDRRNLFRQIADRLRPGGYLVSADLAADLSTSAYESLFEVWRRTLKYSDMAVEDAEKFRASYDQSVALLPPQTVESIIASSGFDTPILFLQTFLIHAWYAQRAA